MLELIYIIVKFVAYVLWCGVGVALFRPQSARLTAALGFGTLRLLLGIFLGATLFLTVGAMNVSQWHLSHLEIYLLMYVPLRWVEWSIMGSLLQPGTQSFLIAPIRKYSGAAIANEPASRSIGVLWKLGGIAISHLADLPLIMAAGGIRSMLPIGRFLC